MRAPAGRPRREKQNRIGRGGVAVDCDGVERVTDRARQQLLKGRRGYAGVRYEEGQHGRHVRGDHARTLGDSIERDRGVPDLHLAAKGLGVGVGGHDRPGRILPASGASPFCKAIDDTFELVRRQRFADDAGGGEIHLARRAPHGGRDQPGRKLRRFPALPAGEGICIAGVDEQRPCAPSRKIVPAPVDGCRGTA